MLCVDNDYYDHDVDGDDDGDHVPLFAGTAGYVRSHNNVGDGGFLLRHFFLSFFMRNKTTRKAAAVLSMKQWPPRFLLCISC